LKKYTLTVIQWYNNDEFHERVTKIVPKEKRLKKKVGQTLANPNQPQNNTRKITSEEAAAIIRNRLATRPVIVWRYSNGKWNKRFIITLAIMIIAMIAALYFFSKNY
jgi:hypothetical protein